MACKALQLKEDATLVCVLNDLCNESDDDTNTNDEEDGVNLIEDADGFSKHLSIYHTRRQDLNFLSSVSSTQVMSVSSSSSSSFFPSTGYPS